MNQWLAFSTNTCPTTHAAQKTNVPTHPHALPPPSNFDQQRNNQPRAAAAAASKRCCARRRQQKDAAAVTACVCPQAPASQDGDQGVMMVVMLLCAAVLNGRCGVWSAAAVALPHATFRDQPPTQRRMCACGMCAAHTRACRRATARLCSSWPSTQAMCAAATCLRLWRATRWVCVPQGLV